MPRHSRKRQGGYALLTLLFLAALALILLGKSLPRAAFEAQRAREDDLIYRGSQYSRAVQLYFRKFRRYPARIEELENTNSVRFLRRRYLDPITKKEEWRLITMGPAGVFTDSLVYDRPRQKKEGEAALGLGPEAGIAAPFTGMADRLRYNPTAPDPGAFPGGAQPGAAGAAGMVTYYNPSQPGATPPGVQQPGVPQPGVTAYPGQPGVPYPGQPGVPAPSGIPGVPGIPGTPVTGAYPGMPTTVTVGGAFPGGAGAQPGAPGAVVPGVAFPGGPGTQMRPPGFPQTPQGSGPFPPGQGIGSEAAKIIQSILTTPRPGGLAGLQGAAQGGAFGASGGTTFGGGIAGVASKSEARGIKVYLEREYYNEWEFVYDYRKDPLVVGAMPGMGGVPGAGVPGQPGAQLPGAHRGMQPGLGMPGLGQPGTAQPGFSLPGFGQPALGQPGQVPITPMNPMQPGLPASPFGVPPGARVPQPPPQR